MLHSLIKSRTKADYDEFSFDITDYRDLKSEFDLVNGTLTKYLV